MASFDGFLVPITQPSFSDALDPDAPIVDGFLVPTQAFASSAQVYFVDAGGPVFRMRAFDTDLSRTVYWDAAEIDTADSKYPGNSLALTNIVVSVVVC